MSIEPSRNRLPVHRRLGPAAIAFLAVAVGVYFTAFLAVSLLRHIIMPVLAVAAGAYVAGLVYRASKPKDN